MPAVHKDEWLVILSEAKDLGSLKAGTKDEILRFAPDDRRFWLSRSTYRVVKRLRMTNLLSSDLAR